jgi:hypothetical protein
MRIICVVLASIFASSVAQAKGIQLFNPDVFGQPTSTAIKILQDKKPDDIEPASVLVDIRKGKYIASSLFYSKKMTFEEARETLNKQYKTNENLSLYKPSIMSVWRVTDKKFTISLVQEDDHVRIMFIQFQPTKEIFKSTLKTMGVDPEELDSADCKQVQPGK